MDDRLFKESKSISSINRLFTSAIDQKKLFDIRPLSVYKRPSKNYFRILTKYKNQLNGKKFQHNNDNNNICSLRTCVITMKQHSCLKDLSDLKPITLSEMEVNRIHYGCYLECKVVAEPFYVTGLHLLVRDNSNEIENLVLYYFNSKSFETDPNVLLPIGTRLKIKEPCLVQSITDNQDFYLRVDSPTNVLVIDDESMFTDKSIDELIEYGNECFKNSKYYSANRAYTQAINKSNNSSIRALLNRSQCYLNLERYYQAYQDASRVINLDETNEKAHFRIAKASYLMNNYEKAKHHYKQCLNLNNNLNEAKLELEKTNSRLNECMKGIYNFEALFNDKYAEIADFHSSKISIVNINNNKNKGVIANENILKGTLLAISNAMSTNCDFKNDNYSIKYNFLTGLRFVNDTFQNTTNIVYKMQSDPDYAKKIYSLDPGSSCPREYESDTNYIDIERIESIFDINSFSCGETKSNQLEEAYTFSMDQKSGIYYLPSFLNHSCICNTFAITRNNVMIIFANRDIEKGKEISSKYFYGDYNERTRVALTKYGFKCDCELCELDKSDLNLASRQKLLNKIKDSSVQNIQDAKKNFKLMLQTYANRSRLQIDLVTPLEMLANKYRQENKLKFSAETFVKIYEILKETSFTQHTIESLKNASKDYKECGLDEKSNLCIKRAHEYFGTQSYIFEDFWNGLIV